MSTPPTVSAARPPRWRGLAAWVLVVLTAVGVTASTVGLWVHRVAFQTDAFMATVTPVVESEAVQGVLSERISDQLTEALDLETRIAAIVSEAEQRLVTRIGEALDVSPEVLERLVDARLGLERIAPALASGAEARIEDAVHRFVSSPEGTTALLSLVEVAHERTVLLLRGETDQLPNLVVSEGEVRFNAVPLIAGALRAAINRGLDVVGLDREIPPFETSEDAEQAISRLAGLLGRDLPEDFGQITIGTGENLRRAQDLAGMFDRIVWLVLIVTVLLAVGAAVLAPSLRRGIVRVGVAMAIGALAGWLILEAVAAGLPQAAATSGGREAIGDMTGALVVSLRAIALLLAAIGVLAAVLGMLPTVIPKRLEIAEQHTAPDAASAEAMSTAPAVPVGGEAEPSPAADQAVAPSDVHGAPADGSAHVEAESGATATEATTAESTAAESTAAESTAPDAAVEPPAPPKPRARRARRRSSPPPDSPDG